MKPETFDEEIRSALEPTAGDVAQIVAASLRSTPPRRRPILASALAAVLMLGAAVLWWLEFDPATPIRPEHVARFEIRSTAGLVVLEDMRNSRISVTGSSRSAISKRSSGPKLFIASGGTQP